MSSKVYSVCRSVVAAAVVLVLSACTSAQQPSGESYDSDPLEPFNRGIYQFNHVVDSAVLKPVAQAYRFSVPKPARKAVGNALRNLGEPVNFLNAVLQGDATQAFTSLWRFLLNSTVGLAGLRDFAGENGLVWRREDFGQTLGYYGVGAGPYLVLPIFGPSSFRDAPGLVVDAFTDPFNYAWDDEAVLARNVINVIDKRERLLKILDDIEETSFDPYATIRSGYLQRRQDEVQNGKVHNTQYYY